MNVKLLSRTLAALAVAAVTQANAGTYGAVAPNLMFDLSHFKLTLPVDASGAPSGTAMTIQNAQLNGSPGYSSPYFYVAADGGLVFYAPSNGATTSPGSGSDHTRSELRELYNVKGTTEWTNRIGGTLSAKCRIDQNSVDSNTTVIGQIHGLSSIMAILDYHRIKQQIEIRLYPTPTSKTSVIVALATGVAPGATISYSMQWIGSTLSITVNGRTTNWTVASAWNDVPVYFKAGAYSSAPSSGNPVGDATKVTFYNLRIQH